MGSIGLGDIRGVEAPDDSKPDFTGVTVPQASPSDVGGRVWNWVLMAELDKVAHITSGSSASTGSFVFSLHLEVAATLATIIL
jgi:hypothetical protein